MNLDPPEIRFGRNPSWRSSMGLLGQAVFWLPLSFIRAIKDGLFTIALGLSTSVLATLLWFIRLVSMVPAGLLGLLREATEGEVQK